MKTTLSISLRRIRDRLEPNTELVFMSWLSNLVLLSSGLSDQLKLLHDV